MLLGIDVFFTFFVFRIDKDLYILRGMHKYLSIYKARSVCVCLWHAYLADRLSD